ncbi:MAG TPA: cyclase family protein [Burkholderiaceae bacterium]|nr:cyclase family protein [Burkholderiaceae bacterium]
MPNPARPAASARAPRAVPVLVVAALAGWSAAVAAVEPESVLAASRRLVPLGPWPAGDERGMGNTIGPGTHLRCGWHLSQPKARSYELSHLRSNTMPKSPFSGPYTIRYKPTAALPFTSHAFNGETYADGAEPAQQATQIDALGHFAFLDRPWDGQGEAPVAGARYYGGFTQQDVKPAPDSPLLKLGMEKAPPLVTTAVLLDARARVGRGAAMKAGDLITAADIGAMLKAQGLAKRGLMPGDIVLFHTGWSERWTDPGGDSTGYYAMGPGLSYDAAQLLGRARVVAIGADVPFVDPVAEGMLQGKAAPAAGSLPNLPFTVHHHMLTQMGIHHLENVRTVDLAADRVWTSCAIVLPLRTAGAAGSAIRPVAIGVPAGRR